MKIQLLPNYFKWIGLVLFIGGGIPDFLRGWADGYNNSTGEEIMANPLPISEQVQYITSILSLVGIIIYALSKEKIEDEFIKVLRWESLSTAFLITTGIVLVNVILKGRNDVIDADFLLEIQLILFLLIFYFKKRNLLA